MGRPANILKKPRLCDWPGCKIENNSLGYFCPEHYLLKEANYGYYDVMASDKEWFSHVEDKSPENRQYFKDWGIKRMAAYVKYKLEHS